MHWQREKTLFHNAGWGQQDHNVYKGATEQDTIDNINQALYRNFGTSVGMSLTDSTAEDGSSIKVMKLVKLNEMVRKPVRR